MTPRMRLNLLIGLATQQQREGVMRQVVEHLHHNNHTDRLHRVQTMQLQECMDILTIDEIDLAARALSRALAGFPQHHGAPQ